MSELIYDFKLPKTIFIGFEKGIGKLEREAVDSTIENKINFIIGNKKDAFFRIKEIKNNEHLPDGYMYELQSGGEKYSYMEKILESINEEKDLYIQTQEKICYIEKSIDTITTYYIDFDEIDEELVFKPTKKEIQNQSKKERLVNYYKEWYPFYSVSLITLIFSGFLLFTASLFKYVILDKQDEYKNLQKTVFFPMNYISNINKEYDVRIKNIYYQNKEWYVLKESKKSDEPQESEKILLNDNIKLIKKELENVNN